MRSVAELCLQKARYALERLTSGDSLAPAFDRPTFKEFVVRVSDGRVQERLEAARQQGIFAGVPLGRNSSTPPMLRFLAPRNWRAMMIVL